MKASLFSHRHIVANDEGFVLVASLLMITVLTLVGVLSIHTTTFEVQISGNDRVAKVNFYEAESAAIAGAQDMYNRDPANDGLDALLPDFDRAADDDEYLLASADGVKPFSEVENLDTVDETTGVEDGVVTMKDLLVKDTNGDPLYANPLGSPDTVSKVILLPSGSGDSLSLGGSRQYTYASYGGSNVNKGFTLIKVGFKKRF